MRSVTAAAMISGLALTASFPLICRAQAPTVDVEDVPDFGLAERPDDLAVVVGIERYRDVPPSDYSARDARLVKDYLKALGFAERNIELLTDGRATLSDIVKAVERRLPEKAKPGSKIFFYYSGHGSPDVSKADAPEAYLLPYDGDPNDLGTTAYPLKRLYEKLGQLPAAEVMVVMDACFSGAGGRSVLARGTRPLVSNIQLPGALPANMAVLSATQANRIATSSKATGHGVLTYHFLKALSEGEGSLGGIYGRIRPRVEDDAKALNVEQSPTLTPDPGKISGRFAFAAQLKVLRRPKRESKPEEASAAQPPSKESASSSETLEVTVRGIKNKPGEVGVAVFNEKKGYPIHIEYAYEAEWIKLEAGQAEAVFIFDSLPPGHYAVSVLHDENGNRKVDRSAMGFPKEGVGFSNGQKVTLKAPGFEKSKIELLPGENKKISIPLDYRN